MPITHDLDHLTRLKVEVELVRIGVDVFQRECFHEWEGGSLDAIEQASRSRSAMSECDGDEILELTRIFHRESKKLAKSRG